MSIFIKNIKKLTLFVSKEPFLFIVVFAITLFLFGHVISSDSILWGWNTPAHFFSVTEMVEYISSGSFSGYSLSWSGGVPLFVLYPPLIHGMIAFFHVLLSSVSLEFFFSFFLFLSLPIYVVSLWYSAKTFFDRSVGKVAILLSLIYILFPGKFYVLGIGASGAFFMGFFNAVWGVSFALLALSFLKNIYDSSDNKERIWYGGFFSLFVALAFLTHTLSFIGMMFFVVLFSLFHIHLRSFLYSLGGVIFSFLLSAFFAIPFFSHLWLSAGRSLSFGLFGSSPFLYTFPFDFSFLRDFTDTSFNIWACIFFFLFIVGGYISMREKKHDALFFWIIGALIFGTTYGLTMFPSLPIHYYRMMPFLLSFALILASYGIVMLWRGGGRYIKGGVVGLVTVMLVFLLFTFDIGNGENRFESQGLFNTYESSYAPQRESYSYYENTEAFLSVMADLPIQRFFAQSSSVTNAGSPHYLMSLAPYLNKQPSVFGLFVESSSQSPFLIPSLEGVMGGRIEWGDDRLSEKIDSFLEQPLDTHIKRVGMFGVSHLIAEGEAFAQRLSESELLKEEYTDAYRSIFSLREYSPLIYPSEYKPGVYMNLDGTLPFRDVALALFEGEKSFSLPLIEWEGNLSQIEDEKDSFSFLLVSGANLPQYKEELENISLPLIILNPNGKLTHPQRYYIHTFEPLSYSRVYPSKPTSSFAWKQLQETALSLLVEDEGSVVVERIDENSISFEGEGAIIINAGYGPSWEIVSSCERELLCRVWHLSPSRMLVFSEGVVSMKHDSPEGWGIVSVLSTVLFMGGMVYVRRKKSSP